MEHTIRRYGLVEDAALLEIAPDILEPEILRRPVHSGQSPNYLVLFVECPSFSSYFLNFLAVLRNGFFFGIPQDISPAGSHARLELVAERSLLRTHDDPAGYGRLHQNLSFNLAKRKTLYQYARMIERTILPEIMASLKSYPVIALLGSRQVGKTTIAKMVKAATTPDAIYLDLELPSDWNKLRDPELYLRKYENRLVILDEIQRMPEIFPLLRALVDQNRVAGRYLILGSASPDLVQKASESLAGRIICHELQPFSLREIGRNQFSGLWIRGGYPDSYLAGDDDRSFIWRESYIRTYLEMDIPQLGLRIPSAQLRRFWTMLAHSHGQLWNAQKIAASLGVTAPTVRHYLDVLEDTFIVWQIQPYYGNIKKRLIKSPKVYVRDSGLLHTLLRIRTLDDLQAHPSLGSSWEGFVLAQVISLLAERSEIFFYRTGAGAEIDLLFFNSKNAPVAVEMKYSLSPKLGRGFWNAFDDLTCKSGFVIYPGDEMYPLGRNVFALPIKDLEKVLNE